MDSTVVLKFRTERDFSIFDELCIPIKDAYFFIIDSEPEYFTTISIGSSRVDVIKSMLNMIIENRIACVISTYGEDIIEDSSSSIRLAVSRERHDIRGMVFSPGWSGGSSEPPMDPSEPAMSPSDITNGFYRHASTYHPYRKNATFDIIRTLCPPQKYNPRRHPPVIPRSDFTGVYYCILSTNSIKAIENILLFMNENLRETASRLLNFHIEPHQRFYNKSNVIQREEYRIISESPDAIEYMLQTLEMSATNFYIMVYDAKFIEFLSKSDQKIVTPSGFRILYGSKFART